MRHTLIISIFILLVISCVAQSSESQDDEGLAGKLSDYSIELRELNLELAKLSVSSNNPAELQLISASRSVAQALAEVSASRATLLRIRSRWINNEKIDDYNHFVSGHLAIDKKMIRFTRSEIKRLSESSKQSKYHTLVLLLARIATIAEDIETIVK